MCAEQAIARKQFGLSLKDFELIKAKVTKMTVATYAMESMSYVTAAIIDKHVKPDSAVEAAIVKVSTTRSRSL
jgi:acyl-CoA dehydrogenase family protein 9